MQKFSPFRGGEKNQQKLSVRRHRHRLTNKTLNCFIDDQKLLKNK